VMLRQNPELEETGVRILKGRVVGGRRRAGTNLDTSSELDLGGFDLEYRSGYEHLKVPKFRQVSQKLHKEMKRKQKQTLDLKPRRGWLPAVGGSEGWENSSVLEVPDSDEPESLPAFVTDTEFASMSSPAFAENLKRMNYTLMTDIQAQTFKHIRQGSDVIGRAKSGTGKTIAFLLPVLERFAASRQRGILKGVVPPEGIHCVVIAPTRELAHQICQEGRALIKGIDGLKIDYCTGGASSYDEWWHLRKLAVSKNFNVLVSSVGRFLSLAANYDDFRDWLQSVQVLILDEVDQLHDLGFRQDILRIRELLPKRNLRQSLMFSATIPEEIQELSKKMLKPDHKFVDTIGEAVAKSESTHETVAQEMIVVPFEQSLPALAASIYKHIEENPTNYKIMVFFSTARVTGFTADLFNATGLPVLVQHSRKEQVDREDTATKFKAAQRAILFTSDMSARGMDFPDITFIIQVGLTSRELYVHRLGRTARSTGFQGSGLLLAAPFEQQALRKNLEDLPIEGLKSKRKANKELASRLNPELRDAFTKALARVADPMSDLQESAKLAYIAWLGYHQKYRKDLRWSQQECVDHANQYSSIIGLPRVPKLDRKLTFKMGLMTEDLQGLNLVNEAAGESSPLKLKKLNHRARKDSKANPHKYQTTWQVR